ncbi:hypothetical protein [Actinomadura sp. 6N118]|uniref:hypothetical protein n=1 Tax=Actinomadura sp. 6N118 TaxID=3375151 RepID=UPI0037ACCED3
MPTPEDEPLQILLWCIALMSVADKHPKPLRRLSGIEDQRVKALSALLCRARYSDQELETMLTALTGRAAELADGLVPPRDVERELGVPVTMIPADSPRLGDHLFADDLRRMAASPPSWLLAARAQVELERAAYTQARHAAEESERRRRAEQEAIATAARAASQLSDESVAELFGLPPDVINGLRPRSGRWSAEHIAQLLRNTPPWLRDVTAAQEEISRRRAAARRRRRT